MFIWFLFSDVCFLVLVSPHPMIQHVPLYPVTNYQHVYLPPYSESFNIQPSNINPYSQQLSIETPVYQTLQISPLAEQIIQPYWDNLISNPSLRQILDPNTITYNKYDTDKQTNLQPFNTRSVVNNYIIVPPDFKINDTAVKKAKTKKGIKVNVDNCNVFNEKVNADKIKDINSRRAIERRRENKQNAKIANSKASPTKQKKEQSWNFNTDNIKCFTPADVLADERYQPEQSVNRGIKKCHQKNSKRRLQTSTNCDKNQSCKCRKTKKNKVKKKSIENRNNKCNYKPDHKSALTAGQKKTEKSNKAVKTRECQKNEEFKHPETKIVEDNTPYCDEVITDLLLPSLLQQRCANLETRQTRNSKTDTNVKDFQIMYSPDDVSKSLTWYMNDIISPQALQHAPNFKSLSGNKYPFELAQFFQLPQYSNVDANKPKGNAETNRNVRRRKKKKKNSKARTNPENSNTSDDDAQIADNNIQTIDQDISEVNCKPDVTTETTSKTIEINTTEIIPVSIEELVTENVCTQAISSENNVLEHYQEPVQYTEDKLEEKEIKSEEDESKEVFETQIPISVVVHENNENSNKIPEYENILTKEIPTLDLHIFNGLGLTPEDEVLRMFFEDYYPDFRADNHAYLVNDEETDVRNINDRYFYVTDKIIDSKELYSIEQEENFYKTIHNEKESENYTFERNDSTVNENDKSQEIVFRTPPGLEVPDFITRKINTDRPDSLEPYYQHDNFRDNFDNNEDSFADKSNHFISKTTNDLGHLVETVYANSKVAKYGNEQELPKTESDVKINFRDSEGGWIQNDGDKIVVIAKSMGPDDFW